MSYVMYYAMSYISMVYVCVVWTYGLQVQHTREVHKYMHEMYVKSNQKDWNVTARQ